MIASRAAHALSRSTRRSLNVRAFSGGDWISDVSLDTKIVHGGIQPCKETGAILTPVYLSTTFVQDSVDRYLEKGYSYSRTNNPTVSMLEQKVATIENGYGSICVGKLR